MAVRGPKKPPPRPVSPGRIAHPGTGTTVRRIVELGLARSPVEAARVTALVLTALRAHGFPVAAIGTAEKQLERALAAFQQSVGLPPDGQLSRATVAALRDAGVLQAAAQDGAQGAGPVDKATQPDADWSARAPLTTIDLAVLQRMPTPEGTSPGQSALHVEIQEAQARNAQSDSPPVDMKDVLSALARKGFPGKGRGAKKLKEAIRQLQGAAKLRVTGEIDRATAAALVERGIVDKNAVATLLAEAAPQRGEHTAQQGAGGDPAAARNGAGDAGRGVGLQGDPNARRLDAGAQPGASPLADFGADAERLASSTQAMADPSSQPTLLGGSALPVEGGGELADRGILDDDGFGNAPAGDEDVADDARGHATVDAEDAAAGHYEVPPLSEQLVAAVEVIRRDDDGVGAATYAWDVVFHRPGVYGAYQPAEELLHIVVSRASPFDALWDQARAAVNSHLAKLEPDADRFSAELLTRALRRARVRELVTDDVT